MATKTVMKKEKKAEETKMLTARELADKAGISPAVLRGLIRKEFNRAGKTAITGNRSEYRFNLSDPVTEQILARVKALKQPKAKKSEVKPNKAVAS